MKTHLHANSMGVPQGSVLDPLLFTAFINNLPNCCLGVNCQIYTDDTVIHVSPKNQSMAGEHLTQALHNISKRLELSHLTFYVKKTVSMCFSICKRSANDVFEVQIKDKVTEAVNEI